MQENASAEASLLSQMTQNVICPFRDEMEIGREAMQIVVDQVRIIVYRSRAHPLSIVDHYQRDKEAFTPQQEALIDGSRSKIPALMEARAKRLSDEASALPPTHFLVLLVLTATIADAYFKPPLEFILIIQVEGDDIDGDHDQPAWATTTIKPRGDNARPTPSVYWPANAR